MDRSIITYRSTCSKYHQQALNASGAEPADWPEARLAELRRLDGCATLPAMLRVGAFALLMGGAAGAAAAAAPPSVRLLTPADGAVLTAGSTVRLEWEPTGALDPAIEEWEAFLSVDGGRYYSVRLTPHLDLDRRGLAFAVPDLPTTEARLLLRFGDEREEVGVEMPARLRIVRGEMPATELAPSALPVPTAGEAARPGDPGVVVWTAGRRDGRSLGHRRAADPPGASPAQLWAMGTAFVVAVPRDPLPSPPPERRPAAASRAPKARAHPASTPTCGADPLLVSGRRNE